MLGLVVAGVATYAAFAGELEDATGRTVLPVARRRRGARSMAEGLAEQLDGVEHEPGVRKVL